MRPVTPLSEPSVKMRNLLLRGLLAGALASALAFGVATVAGEPQIERAIAFEDAVQRHPEVPATVAPVSRGMQRTLGLATALGAIGMVAGGVFALAFAAAYGRLGRLGVRGTSLGLALGAFGAISLVPWLKYPANPPAGGDPDTIGTRTALYFAMMLIAVVASAGAAMLWRRLATRRSTWGAALTAAGALLLVLTLAFVLLPPAEAIPAGFPTTTLWRFRLAALGTQAALWLGIGLTFGALVERLEARAADASVRARARA